MRVPDAWRRNADVIAIYFATLGRLAPVDAGPDGRSVVLRPLGSGLITMPAESFSMVGFVIAMLATVLFDGLLGTEVMALVQRTMTGWIPLAPVARGYVLGTIGLIGIWLLFLGAYLLSCFITAWLVRDRPVATIARMFAFTLVPIAIAYNIAHRLALRKFSTPRQAVLASIPLTCLMVIYTAISLLIMAEPLVRFGPAAMR